MEENNSLEQKDTVQNIVEETFTDVILGKKDRRFKSPHVVNKRIDFSEKTFKKLQMMMPIYQNDIDDAGQNEIMSYVVEKAIDKLFDEEFKKIVENL